MDPGAHRRAVGVKPVAPITARSAKVPIVEGLCHFIRSCAHCDAELQPRCGDRNRKMAAKRYCWELCRKRAQSARSYKRRRLNRAPPPVTILELSCKKCGRTFEAKHQRGRRPYYCSKECRKRPLYRPAHAARTPRVVEFACSECQVTTSYLKLSSGRERKFCSAACRSNYQGRMARGSRVRAKRPKSNERSNVGGGAPKSLEGTRRTPALVKKLRLVEILKIAGCLSGACLLGFSRQQSD